MSKILLGSWLVVLILSWGVAADSSVDPDQFAGSIGMGMPDLSECCRLGASRTFAAIEDQTFAGGLFIRNQIDGQAMPLESGLFVDLTGTVLGNQADTLVLQPGDALPQPQVLGLGGAFKVMPQLMPIPRGVVAEYEVVVEANPSIVGRPESFMIVR